MKSEHLTRSFFRPNLPQAPPSTAWTGVSAWSSHATGMQQPGQWAFQGQMDPSTGGKAATFVDAGAVCMGGMPAQWSNGWVQSSAYVPQTMQDMHGSCKGKGQKGGRPRQGSKGSGKFAMQGFNASMAVPQSAPPAAMREASRERGYSDTDSAIGTGVVHGLEGLTQGYAQEFRQYSRTEILDICSKVSTLEMPESFQKLREDEHDALLFRAAPCEDWAPAPSPRMSFSFNNGTADRSRSNTEDGGSAITDGASAAWANQREEGYSQAAQGSWNASGYDEHWGSYDSWSAWSRGKDRWWANPSWKGGGATSSQSRQRWVEKKEADDAQLTEQQGEPSLDAAVADADVWPKPGSRTQTWAEKARGLADTPGAGQGGPVTAQKWVAKNRPSASEGDESTRQASENAAEAVTAGEASAAPTAVQQTVDTAAAPSAEPAKRGSESPTWADKVRQGKNSPSGPSPTP